ncbi:MAG: DUF3795 domain-containing protein [Acidobacteria bacterium]|nr:DUF3795 domain-containing protein [Acidobacteriota bacterium]
MNTKNKECTSRREFVQEVAGVAGALVCAPCLGRAFALSAQDAAAKGTNKADEGSGELLVAPCGLYCGACPMYLASQEKDDQKLKAIMQQFGGGKMQLKREDLLCDGCIGGGRVAAFCRKCEMRSCAEGKPNVTRCSDCSEFPCTRITSFNNDGMQHHSEVLSNLRRLKGMGIKEWTEYEEDRWRCPQCRTKLSWYDKACSKCGAKRSERLFPLKQA